MNDLMSTVASRRAVVAAGALAAFAPVSCWRGRAAEATAEAAGGTVRGVPGKTGEMPGPDLDAAPVERWRVALARGRWSEPVTDGVRVYACRSGGGVAAIDLATGAEAWRIDAAAAGGAPLGFDAAPCVAGDGVVAGGERWTLLGLDAATGTESWRYVREVAFPEAMPSQAADSMTTLYGLQFGAPTVVDGVAFAGGGAASGDGSNPPTAAKGLYAVDAATGALRWQYPLGSGVMASPAVADGMVFVTDLDAGVHAVSAADGELRWTVPSIAATGPGHGPAASGGLVHVPTLSWGAGAEPGLVAFDAATGETAWRRTLSGKPVTAPAVADGLLLAGTWDGALLALDAATGKDRWKIDIGSAPLAAVVVPGGLAYVATAGGTLHAIDAAGGAERWRVDGGVPFASPPLVVGGMIVVADAEGALRAFGRERAG